MQALTLINLFNPLNPPANHAVQGNGRMKLEEKVTRNVLVGVLPGDFLNKREGATMMNVLVVVLGANGQIKLEEKVTRNASVVVLPVVFLKKQEGATMMNVLVVVPPAGFQ